MRGGASGKGFTLAAPYAVLGAVGRRPHRQKAADRQRGLSRSLRRLAPIVIGAHHSPNTLPHPSRGVNP